MSSGVQPPVFDDTSESISFCVRPPMKRCKLITERNVNFHLIEGVRDMITHDTEKKKNIL